MKFLILLFLTFGVKAQWIDFSTKQGQLIKPSEIASNFDYLKDNVGKARVNASIFNSTITYGHNGNNNLGLLIFNNEDKDDTGMYDNTNGQITADKNMTLLVDISLWAASNAVSSIMYVAMEKSVNGGASWTEIERGKVYANSADRGGAELHTQVDLNQGDKIRFFVYYVSSNRAFLVTEKTLNVLRLSEL